MRILTVVEEFAQPLVLCAFAAATAAAAAAAQIVPGPLPLVILLFLPLAEGGKRELTQDLQACVVKHNEKDSTHALAGFDGRR